MTNDVHYRRIATALQDACDRIDEDYSDDPEAAAISKKDLVDAKWWLDGLFLNNQTQAQRYSHRNGETEPPGVEGWYWYELESDDWRIVEVDNGGVYEDSFAAYYSGVEASSDVAYMRGRWYGPIPEPVQEARHDDDA